MTNSVCKSCNKEIDDSEGPSVQCQACNKRVHSFRDCSGIKKTFFDKLTKNDTFICPSCVKLVIESKGELPLQLLKDELSRAQEMNQDLNSQNKELLGLLDDSDRQIARLTRELRELNEQYVAALRCIESGESLKRENISFSPVDTSNRFEVLTGREDDGETAMLEDGKSGGHTQSNETTNIKTDSSKVNRPRKGGGKNKPSVIIVTDSQGKKLSECLKEKTKENVKGNEWETTTWVMPGAPFGSVLESASGMVRRVRGDDCMIVMGGVNEVDDGSVKELDNRLSHLADKAGDGRVVFIETPYRYDIGPQENDLITRQNCKIRNACKKHNWTYIRINELLIRDNYTRHGLHLNRSGKNIVAEAIVNYLGLIGHRAESKNVTESNRAKVG